MRLSRDADVPPSTIMEPTQESPRDHDPSSPETPVESIRSDIRSMHEQQQAALTVIVLVGVLWILWVAKAFLVPIVLAFFALVIVSSLDRVWAKISIAGRRIPQLAGTALSAIVIGAFVVMVMTLVLDSASTIANNPPSYDDNVDKLYARISGSLSKIGITMPEELQSLLDRIDFTQLIRRVASGTADVLGTGAIVLVYLFFLVFERQFFAAKMRAIFKDDGRRTDAAAMIDQIGRDIGKYLGMKTLVSLMTAAPSYLIMQYVGLDFAEFWTLLIFVLNFIPNIGSLIATALPAMLSLLQFEGFREFLIVAVGIVAVQLIVANLIEPNLMGRSLNMSSLAVILSLFGWSLLWGMAGAFLCVPMTVVAMIILSHFPSTRSIAVILSRDGKIGKPTPT